MPTTADFAVFVQNCTPTAELQFWVEITYNILYEAVIYNALFYHVIFKASYEASDRGHTEDRSGHTKL